MFECRVTKRGNWEASPRPKNKASLNRTNVVSAERDVVDGGAVVKRSLPFLGSYGSRVPHFLGCRDRTHAKQRSHISKRFTGRILRPFS